MKNKDMAFRVMDHINQEDTKWNQKVWRVIRHKTPEKQDCGTAMCFAGWTCQLDQDTVWATDVVDKKVTLSGLQSSQELVLAWPDEDPSYYLDPRTGRFDFDKSERYYVPVVVAADRAARVLGLEDSHDEVQLFHYLGRSKAKMQDIVCRIFGDKLSA